MNFPAQPRGGLYISATPPFSPRSLLVRRYDTYRLFQSLFPSTSIRWRTPPSFGTAKVENFFKLSRIFLKKIEVFYFFTFYCLSSTFALFQSAHSSISSSPSEAGCKGSNYLHPSKGFLKRFYLFLLKG